RRRVALHEGGDDAAHGVDVLDALTGAVERDGQQVARGGLVEHRRHAELQVTARLGGCADGDGDMEEAAEERGGEGRVVRGREHGNHGLDKRAVHPGVISSMAVGGEHFGQQELSVCGGCSDKHLGLRAAAAQRRDDLVERRRREGRELRRPPLGRRPRREQHLVTDPERDSVS
ncbi:Os12g0117500, partial [Oryza sativa Japonica Group]